MIGALCLGIAALTNLDLYEYAVSNAISGAIGVAMGSTVVAMSRNADFVSQKLAAIATFLALGSVLLTFWYCWERSSIGLGFGLIGLYEGIFVGARTSAIEPIAKKTFDEI